MKFKKTAINSIAKRSAAENNHYLSDSQLSLIVLRNLVFKYYQLSYVLAPDCCALYLRTTMSRLVQSLAFCQDLRARS